MMLGSRAMQTLAASRVAVFGVGGVGGYAVEVLARSGVGAIDLFDNDRVCVTNVNRQIIALTTNIGRFKVDVAAERIAAINPDCRVTVHHMFYLPANADEVDLTAYDYVVDCVDTVSAKMELIRRCTRLGIPFICSMGAANKLDPTAFCVADAQQSRVDPLARVLRKMLGREGIRHFKCVYSPEKPLIPQEEPQPFDCPYRHLCGDSADGHCGTAGKSPASNAFVPAAAGLILGGEVIKDLTVNKNNTPDDEND